MKQRLALDSEGPNCLDDTFQDYSEGERAVVQSNATLHRETLNASSRGEKRFTRARKVSMTNETILEGGSIRSGMSTRKRSSHIHDSQQCETYSPKELRYKRFRVEEINARWISLTTHGLDLLQFKIDFLLVSELEERWDNS